MTGLQVKPTQPTSSLRSQLPQLERWRKVKVKVNALLVLVTMCHHFSHLSPDRPVSLL